MKAQVLLVDVDGTLCSGVCWTPEDCIVAVPNEDVIKKVAEFYLYHFIVIYTARRDELIPATLEWLRRNNVRYHAISNLKIPSHLGMVDDMAITIQDFLKMEV